MFSWLHPSHSPPLQDPLVMNDQELRQTLAEAEMHRDEHQAVTEVATQREEAPLATACFDLRKLLPTGMFCPGFVLHAACGELCGAIRLQ